MYRFEMERKDQSSPYFGAYRHPLFVRDKLDLCARMTRRPKGRPAKKKSTTSSATWWQLHEQQVQKQDPLHGLLLLPKEDGRKITRSKFPMGLRPPQQRNSRLVACGVDDADGNFQNHNELKSREKPFNGGYCAPSPSACCPCPASNAIRRLNSNRETPSVLNSSTVVHSTGNEMLTSRRRTLGSLEAERDEESLMQFAIQASQRLMMTDASSKQRACTTSSETSSLLTWSTQSVLSSRTQFQSSRNRSSVNIVNNDDWRLFASLFGPTDDNEETKP